MRRPRLAVLCALLTLTLTAQRPTQAGNGHKAPRTSAGASTAYYIGVLGQVARPGVYKFETASPALGELIDAAGGLTTRASRHLRVVRNGRAGQQMYYAPDTQYQLFSGDLVVVPSKDRREADSRSSGRGGVGQSAGSGGGGPVQLALLNLLRRPVVLKVSGRHATVPALVSLLGQSSQAAAGVRVLRPWNVPTGSDANRKRLASGSVLVFDPASVDYDALPPLDRTIPAKQPETANGRTGAPLRSTPANSTDEQETSPGTDLTASGAERPARLRSDQQSRSDGGAENVRAFRLSTGPNLTPPSDLSEKSSEDDKAGAATILSSRPPSELQDNEPEDRSAKDSPPRGSSERGAGTGSGDQRSGHMARSGDRPQRETSPGTAQRPNRPGQTDENQGTETDQFETARQSFVWFGLGLGLFAASLAVFWAACRTMRSRKETAETLRQQPNALDALIENALPLTEEPLSPPSPITLDQRPTTGPHIRVDAPSQPNRPAPERPAPEHQGDSSGGPRRSTPATSDHQAAGLLERALASAHKARQA